MIVKERNRSFFHAAVSPNNLKFCMFSQFDDTGESATYLAEKEGKIPPVV